MKDKLQGIGNESEIRTANMVQLMEHIPGGFFICRADDDMRITAVNSAMIRLMGCDTEERFMSLTGASFRGLVHPDDLERVLKEIDLQIMSNEHDMDHVEYRMTRRDGTSGWLWNSGQLMYTADLGLVFYVFVEDVTKRHEEEDLNRRRLRIEQNRYKDVLVRGSAFYFELELSDGLVRDPVIAEEYDDIYRNEMEEGVRYDDLFRLRKKVHRLVLEDPESEQYWTCEGLRRAYEEGTPIVELEYYSEKEYIYWKADILLSEGEQPGSVHAVYVCRDITEQKKIAMREYAHQQMAYRYIEKRCELSAAIDLQTGAYEVITRSDRYVDLPDGSFPETIKRYSEQVLPEQRADYLRNLSPENLRAQLATADSYTVQVFVRKADGGIARKQNTFIGMDESGRQVLAVVKDTTQEYLIEQEVARARRESAAAVRLPESAFLQSLVHRDHDRHTILVVEDNEMNREILKEILAEEFDVMEAADGEEGLAVLRESCEHVDLVLLDVYMPRCDGFEFLRRRRGDACLTEIPVIVATGSNKREDETRCLELGASDFVTKPYNPDIILSRIHAILDLKESIATLEAVEFDDLTGVYTIPAFRHHVRQKLQSGSEWDMLMLDIWHFAMINRLHGARKGEDTLKYVASTMRRILPGALLSREGDHFYALMETARRRDPETLPALFEELRADAPVPDLNVKIGAYNRVDATQPVTILCDRAKLAADTIRSEGVFPYAVYDEGVEARRIRERNLLTAFPEAARNDEFRIYLQPKVEPETGRICGAEALVRWITADGHFISPGDFIPLFEREGPIRELDEHIFRKVCAFQSDRQRAGLPMVPISVNLSRNSLFSGSIAGSYAAIAREAGISCELVPLEITESAADSADQIRSVCSELTKAGFSLHMDDFGTGYSSLAALSKLPFSVIKLDKSLIDRIGTPLGEVLLHKVIELMQDMGMRVVAEGVEDVSQLALLRQYDCDLIQGYYFSAPMPAERFGELLDREEPYRTKLETVSPDRREVLSLTRSELKRYLHLTQTVFERVRVLEANCLRYRMADAEGALGEAHETCYEVWRQDGRCDDCISLRAMRSKHTEQKFQVCDDEIYLVFAHYVEVDGMPHVIEMLAPVGSGLVNGYHGLPTLKEAIGALDMEIYRDVQLGILNRRFYEEQLGTVRNIDALAMLDFDHFKQVNDTYGHMVGDVALKAVVDTVKRYIRKEDYLIRMGGDEFLLVYTGIGEARLEKRLNEIRRAVEEIRLPEHPELRLTVTIGGCCFRRYTQGLVEIADQALYEGKEKRNSVVVKHMRRSGNE